ncbi:MAG: glycogen debranching protein GlgX, partial [Actinomycetes bacterium]
MAYRLAGSSDMYADDGRSPYASINFVTAHDGFTLRDLVSYDEKHNEANGEDGQDGIGDNHSWNCGVEGETDEPAVLVLRHRMMRNLLATLALSSGVPMLTAGDETGRTQRGNNNAFCLDDETTWLSWAHEPWQRDLYAWTRALLAVRRGDRALRHDEFFEGRPTHPAAVKDLAWFGADGVEMTAEGWFDHDQRVLAMYVSGVPEPGDADVVSLLVVLNTGPATENVVLPDGKWAVSYAVLLDTTADQPAPGPELAAGAPLTMVPHSLQVLAARR